MSTPPSPAAGQPILVPNPVNTSGPLRVRHPLGLPAGSVRALLALMVLGLIWAILVLQDTQNINPPPIYLYYLMLLILGNFFAAHGHSIAGPGSVERSPLYLPRGVIRTILFLGFIGVFAWRYYKDQSWDKLWDLKQPELGRVPYLAFLIVGTFLLGILLGHLIRWSQRGTNVAPYWFHDILAWLALLAVIGLVIEVLILVVINPGLPEDRQIRQLPALEVPLAAVISFYFGLRS
jgi:hypothetical protein